ncbi:MAG TPA: hypothetical protein VGO53_00050, partial [Steroidobacteraceae bacterium]|nr:hypothetical protein [Steroidobacteraceae bacterium]
MDQSAHPSLVLPRRAIVLAAIVALHLLLVWALASGLASTAVRAVVGPMSGDIYPNPVPDERPPPALDPKFVQPTIDPGPAPD